MLGVLGLAARAAFRGLWYPSVRDLSEGRCGASLAGPPGTALRMFRVFAEGSGFDVLHPLVFPLRAYIFQQSGCPSRTIGRFRWETSDLNPVHMPDFPSWSGARSQTHGIRLRISSGGVVSSAMRPVFGFDLVLFSMWFAFNLCWDFLGRP